MVDRARLMVEHGYEQILRTGHNPTGAIFAAFCLIMGVQMLFFSMWMDMEHNKGLK